jgi:hypothetical protein
MRLLRQRVTLRQLHRLRRQSKGIQWRVSLPILDRLLPMNGIMSYDLQYFLIR